MKQVRYVYYAREFGWTPDQVDNIPLRLEPWLMPIHAAIEGDIARRHTEAAEEAKREAERNKPR